MRYLYEPFILRRAAEGRIFFVSPKMPFEFFLQCFQAEQPFFLVSHLEDGRLAITPNVTFVPWNVVYGGYGPMDLLPTEWEYVTIKNASYPLIITAHPVSNVEEWFRKFEWSVSPFARQSLTEFVSGALEFQPIQAEGRTFEGAKWSKTRTAVAEPVGR
jgi:hypothetical protein